MRVIRVRLRVRVRVLVRWCVCAGSSTHTRTQVDHQVREAEAESRQFFELWAPDQSPPPRIIRPGKYNMHQPSASSAIAVMSSSSGGGAGASLYTQHPLGSPYRNSRADRV